MASLCTAANCYITNKSEKLMMWESCALRLMWFLFYTLKEKLEQFTFIDRLIFHIALMIFIWTLLFYDRFIFGWWFCGR